MFAPPPWSIARKGTFPAPSGPPATASPISQAAWALFTIIPKLGRSTVLVPAMSPLPRNSLRVTGLA